jgi:GntR family transcriptional regulator
MDAAIQDHEWKGGGRRLPDDTPRFQQVVEDFKRQIASDSLAEHAALPSERRIAEVYDISRMTARRALDALEVEGLVYSEDRRGRFVSPKRVSYDVSNMVSFVAEADSRGLALEIEVIRALKSEADAMLAEHLGVEPGAEVYTYTRLFRNNGHAIFVETEYVNARRCPGFLEHDLQQSTTRLLESRYDLSASAGDIEILMRAATAEETNLLSLARNSAGIELTQTIRDRSGRVFCFGRQFWRGEAARFSARAIVERSVHD